MRKLVFSSRWSKVKQALEEDNWQTYALRTNCGQRMRYRLLVYKQI